MRNLISYNSSFIWEDKLKDRNNCISNFNNFYLEAKEQDKFYLKKDLDTTLNSIIIELIEFKEYNEMKKTFPWLSPDSYNLLYTLLEIKKTETISNDLIDYNINHLFKVSSWMGIGVQDINEYSHDILSWKKNHTNFVMKFSRNQRLENDKYFKKFCKGELKIDANIIKRKIEKGYYKYFDRIDIPKETEGNPVHCQQTHIHLKNGGALNIDGSVKHNIKSIPNNAKDQLIELGFILPENLDD